MTDAALAIFVRVIKRRIDKGEQMEDILESYSKLTEEEKNKIRDRISK